ncbi:MAG: sugar transferase [Chloroflexota bacterium]|nr:sugar transferase [Chloroflexota bacterium]
MNRPLHRLLLPFYILGDLSLTAFALYAAALLRQHSEWGKQLDPSQPVVPSYAIYVGALAIWFVIFRAMEVYEPQRVLNRKAALMNLLQAVPIAVLVLSGALYLSFREVSRLLIVYFAVIDLLLLLVFRVSVSLVLSLLQSRGRCIRPVAIVGCNQIGAQVAAALQSSRWSDLRVVGYIDDRATKRDVADDVPLLGPTNEIEALIVKHEIEEVIVALPVEDHERIDPLVLRLLPVPVKVRLVPNIIGLSTFYATVDQVNGVPLIGLRDSAISGMPWVIKRAFDLVVAGLALLLVAPVMAAVALWVWLDDGGPILFKQQRVGENGQPFTMYKFRSMRAMGTASTVPANGVKLPHDPRITRSGRWLRRFSLDELPQLLNVLRGDMSLVGPRPEVIGLMGQYQPWQRKRLAVPPGITGWWQVNGRSDAPLHLNTDYDLYYIQNYSFWLDLVILFRTLGAVVRGRGAY